jgi:hypothetical protein
MSKKRERPPEAHDVLLIPRLFPPSEKTPDGRAKMLIMEVKEDGGYKESKWLEGTAPGARKVYNIARPVDASESPQRGPGFAILPIRPDPGSQFNTCFLINTENLFLPNPWTAANWDAFDPATQIETSATKPSEELPPDPDWRQDGFELLIAGPQGKVFHVEGGTQKGGGTVQEIDLHEEPEIWAQLREGVIVGTVWCAKLNRVVPIVNATAVDVRKGANHSSAKGARS